MTDDEDSAASPAAIWPRKDHADAAASEEPGKAKMPMARRRMRKKGRSAAFPTPAATPKARPKIAAKRRARTAKSLAAKETEGPEPKRRRREASSAPPATRRRGQRQRKQQQTTDVEEEGDVELQDSDFDSSDLDAVLMAVGGHEGALEESGKTAQRWNARRRNRKRRQKKVQREADLQKEEESLDGAEAPRMRQVREVNCQATPAARELLKKGQVEFAGGNFDAAIETMRAAIREQPGLADPYHVLHLIYEEKGDQKKALDALTLAAYVTSPAQSKPVWRKVADMSMLLGLTDQAGYAFKRSIAPRGKRDKDDLTSMWELSQLLLRKGRVDRGIEMLFELYEETEDSTLACEVAQKLVQRHRWKECLALLEGCVEKGRKASPPRVDLNTLNMYCEVLMEVREFDKCANLIIELLHLRPAVTSSSHVASSSSSSSSSSTALALPSSSSTALALPEMGSEALLVKLQSSPIDLVAKLAAALCRLPPPSDGDEGMEVLRNAAIEVVISHPPETHCDLYLMLIDAMLKDEGTTEATVSQRWPRRSKVRRWPAEQAKRILALLDDWPGLDEDLRERKAMCLWRLGQVEDAALQLEALLEEPGDRTDLELRNLRVRVAEAWIEHGDTQRADRVLSTLSYEDLQRSNTLPPALSAAERRRFYQELSETLEAAFSAASAAGDLGRPHLHVGSGSDEDVESFISRFRHLVYDCELDYKRLSSYTSNASAAAASAAAGGGDSVEAGAADQDAERADVAADAGGEEPAESCTSIVVVKAAKPQRGLEDPLQASSTAHKMKRRHLGLDSVEDMFGTEAYLSLVLRGVDVVRSYSFSDRSDRSRQSKVLASRAVELCEMILMNRRLVALRNPVKRRMMRNLALKSLSVGFEARLWRVVFKHLRSLCKSSDNDDLIALITRILFTHADVDVLPSKQLGRDREDAATWEQDKFSSSGHACFSSSGHRNTYAAAFTDVRSWALRKLLRRPRSFGLTLLCGHFCIIASQYPFAVAEYSRAHRLAPQDALTSLCTATAYLSFSMSRAAVHRHDLVLKGLTFLQRYRRLRLRGTGIEQDGDEEVLLLHSPESWGGPAPERQSWEAEPPERLERIARRAEAAYNYGRAFHQLSINDLAVEAYESALDMLDGADTNRADLKVIRQSSAFNLASIFRAQGSLALASEVLWRHVVF
eukprot:TRINITY_DN29517_c0_g1_i1.p1 TRINITY_DN29517_c0_g1~~TRINITY_DN29517_c0_g1_i1.p1  ORF type:complete len:1174 (-),score=301.63 TRINITY_DN29517_c0_g1_i1:7-3528(-)